MPSRPVPTDICMASIPPLFTAIIYTQSLPPAGRSGKEDNNVVAGVVVGVVVSVLVIVTVVAVAMGIVILLKKTDIILRKSPPFKPCHHAYQHHNLLFSLPREFNEGANAGGQPNLHVVNGCE